MVSGAGDPVLPLARPLGLNAVMRAVAMVWVLWSGCGTAAYAEGGGGGNGGLWNRPVFRVADDHVFISGLIAQRHVRALRNHRRPIAVVSLNSTGGEVAAVLEVARILRRRRVTTYVGFGAACISGCTLLFQAGVERVVHPRAVLGYHQPRSVNGDPIGDGDDGGSALRSFRDMYMQLGLPPALLAEFWHPGIVVYHGAARLAEMAVATRVENLGLATR